MGGIVFLLVIIILTALFRRSYRQEHIDSGNAYLPEQSLESDSQKPDSQEPDSQESGSDASSDSSNTPYRKIFKFFLFLFVTNVILSALFYRNYGNSLGSTIIFDFFLYSIIAGLCCLIYSYIIIPISNVANKSTGGNLYKAIQERDGKEELLGAIEAYGNAELLDMRDKYIHSPSPSLFVELEIAFFKQVALDQNVESAYRIAGELGLSYEEITAIAKSFDSDIDDDAAHRIWEEAHLKREEKSTN